MMTSPSHAKSGSGRSAVFIDLDKTLIPGSSLYQLARGLYGRGYCQSSQVARFGLEHLRFRVSGIERGRGIELARQSALSFVQGRSRTEIRELSAEIAAERILPRVYGAMIEVIEERRATGEPVYLVTAAPLELAQLVADHLGMQGALGTTAEVDHNGRYTGRLVGPILRGQAKADAVAALAVSNGIDLDTSAGYSDSSNDLPLLEMVGRPHAVNPDRRLRAAARARGWPVLEMRHRHQTLIVSSVAAGCLAVAAGAGAGLTHRHSTGGEL
jgi:HAD superfamily hydrolase (TIGR01490 family)